MDVLISWIASGILLGTIIMIGACGEILTEKSGHLNLGVPGVMFLSGFIGYFVAYSLENSGVKVGFLSIVLPILCSFIIGGILGLLYSFMTVSLKCNQNVVGLVLTSFGVGFGTFLCVLSGTTDGKAEFAGKIYNAGIPLLKNIPFLGDLLFNYGFLVYLTIILAVVLHLFLKKTRIGLNLRAVGESPATADAAGINVSRYKYLATIVGCGLCGVAGIAYVLLYGGGLWSTNNNIEAIGWLAVALVIFATWKPVNLIWGSYLFGLLFWAHNYVPTLLHLPKITGLSELIKMLPYIVTIVVLIVNSLKKKRDNQPPESLGLSYFREDR